MASLNVDFSGSTLFPWQQLKQAYVCAHRAMVDGRRDTRLHSAIDIDHENVALYYYDLFDIAMSPVHRLT